MSLEQNISEGADYSSICAFLAGDASAMDALLDRHGSAVMTFLSFHTAGHDDAAEIFQETWLRVIKRASSFKGGSFRAWVITIARNQIIDRARKSRPTVSLDAPIGDEDEVDGATLADLLADENSPPPEEALIAEEKKSAVAKAVNALPKSQREIFLLRTQQEMSFADIAKLLKIPLNTALSRMHYAMKKLKEDLEDLL